MRKNNVLQNTSFSYNCENITETEFFIKKIIQNAIINVPKKLFTEKRRKEVSKNEKDLSSRKKQLKIINMVWII